MAKMPNLMFLGKTPKCEPSEALILGHPQKRFMPKIKSPYTTGLDYNYKKDKNIVIILCIVLIIILILMYMIVRNFILG